MEGVMSWEVEFETLVDDVIGRKTRDREFY
jgi:hypothetical protein